MDGPLDHIDPRQLDVLKEIGSIGSGNAVTALASLLNKTINMNVPEVKVVPFDSIINILSGPESLAAGVLVDMSGDLSGYILLILELQDAYEIASAALGEQRAAPESLSPDDLTELELSAITEVANILVGAYLSAICTMTGLHVTPSVPQLAIDMLGAIVSIVAIEYGQIGDSVLFLKTLFSDVERDLSGHFFLIPDFESYQTLMKSLGLDV